MLRVLIVVAMLVAGSVFADSHRVVTFDSLSKRPAAPADHRIFYGSDEFTFGDLRLPRASTPHPVAVVIHGGCWRSANDLQHISHLSAALVHEGLATWTLEYRRVGNPGGGWPGTFQDVAAGTDYIRVLARRFPLDLKRVMLIGHSAGGHLALWVAPVKSYRPKILSLRKNR